MSVRLVALLNWFDERPDFLADVVRSLKLAEVDVLVALDGPYRLYPATRDRSDASQYHAITDTAQAVGIPATVQGRLHGWDSECEKRTHLFTVGDSHQPDWYLIVDADEVILQAPADLKDRLAAAGSDYADCLSLEHAAPVAWAGIEDGDGDDVPAVIASRHVKPRRCLFRAVPGLTVGPAHYDYMTPDGRNLWGDQYGRPLLVRDMVIDHRTLGRDTGRREASLAYYDRRDKAGIERVAA